MQWDFHVTDFQGVNYFVWLVGEGISGEAWLQVFSGLIREPGELERL